MNYYDSKYRDEVNGIISDIFYVPTSNDNKISTIRRYAEIIVRRLADWDMDEAITLGDKNVIEKLKKKGVNEQMFWAAYNTIRTCGNNRTHTQVTTTATDQEYNLVVDRLLDLYAYLFVDFFKRYRFGNNPNILTSFSILPPIIRYKALLELYNNLGMYHIQSKQKSRLFKTLICSECDTAGLYQVA